MVTRPLRQLDSLRVPVTVFSSGQPITTSAWPSASKAALVRTTWRALVLASVSVGRPVTRLRASFPSFAGPEIRARVDVLRSGLQRAVDGVGNPIAEANEWLLTADPSEKAAVGYRAGMAGAHWACALMLGLSNTRHVSLLDPAHPARGGKQQADLWELHPWGAPSDWLIEAKGGLTIKAPTRVNGAAQLDSARTTGASPWRTQHVQALVSTRLDPALQLVVELGLPAGVSLPPDWSDPSAWPIRPRGTPPPSRARLFWARALLGSALLNGAADATSVVRLDGGLVEVRLLDLPGFDVQVGLLESAYQTLEPQLLRAQQLEALGVQPDRIGEEVTADGSTDETEDRTVLDAILNVDPGETATTRLLLPRPTASSSVASWTGPVGLWSAETVGAPTARLTAHPTQPDHDGTSTRGKLKAERRVGLYRRVW